MDSRFDKMVDDPQNQVFQVVFFPDRIYHAQYLNATRSARYRYNVTEVRRKADINVLKGEVYLDGIKLCNFLRIEYGGGRLAETARERMRFLGPDIRAYVALAKTANTGDYEVLADAENVRLHFCPWVRAYQVEFWETLEPPAGKRHDYQVLDLMGHLGSITCLPQFVPLLDSARMKEFDQIKVAFGEDWNQWPNGRAIHASEASWDNFFQRNIQVPNTQDPSSEQNTVPDPNYGIYFQRGWLIEDVGAIDPVRYANGMMEESNPHFDTTRSQNIIEMRWVLQQQMGGTLVFFHEVTIPPGTFEGVHQHIGSEELYFIVEGHGTAFLGEADDPALASAPLVKQHIYGFGPRDVREVKVKPRSAIFTKSGGIHGIRNESQTDPLRFVAFLYHSA